MSARTTLAASLLISLLLGMLGVMAGPATAAEAPAAGQVTGQVTWATAPADTAVGKGRAHFAYTLAPGGTVTDAIAVVNRSPTTIKLRVYASDAFSTPAGGIDLLPADKKPVDVGSWTTLKTSTITLKPQQSTVVPFTLKVPANATPGDHSGGVVTSLVTAAGTGAVTLDRRLGSRMYLRVTGALRPNLAVSDVHATYQGTLNPGGSGSTVVAYTVTNNGNVRLAAHQRIRVASPFGAIAFTATLPDLPEILPGDSLTRSYTVTGVWPATRMTTSVQLQPVASGDQPPIAVPQTVASVSVWALPWGQLIVLVLLIALVLAYLQLRRRRELAMSAAIAAAVSEARKESEPQLQD
jgi:hypothetical protein